MVLPFKSPSAAQVLPLTHLHRLSELVFRMLAFFFRIASEQALTDGASFLQAPNAAQVLPSTQLHRLLELVFRMSAFFFQIAPKQAVTDGAPFQEPECCPSASVDPSASFVGIGFPNVGILFPNRPKTSCHWWRSLSRARVLPKRFR